MVGHSFAGVSKITSPHEVFNGSVWWTEDTSGLGMTSCDGSTPLNLMSGNLATSRRSTTDGITKSHRLESVIGLTDVRYDCLLAGGIKGGIPAVFW